MTERSNPFSSRRRVNAPHDPPVARQKKQAKPQVDVAEEEYQRFLEETRLSIWGRP